MKSRFKIQDLGFKNLIFILILTSYILNPTSINAQSVDILWQADTYTPPFYHGRALWSKQSAITFTAVTQGLPNPSGLTYTWVRNGTVLGLVSGVGKDSLTFMDTIFSKPVTIKVRILSNNEELLAENSLTLTPVSPQLLVYENNPLYGFLFNKEVSSGFFLPTGEVTLAAFPLFFTTPTRDYATLNYVWRSNVGEDDRDSSVTYRVPEEAAGSSSISLKISNLDFFKQVANTGLLVQFGQNNE